MRIILQQLPRRSLATALILGATVGAIFLGVGGRVAMRVFALFDGRAPGFSVGGSMTVVFMGAAWGMLGGVLLWLGRRYLKASPIGRGALYWVPLTVIYLRGINPFVTIDGLIAFGPPFLLYGTVLYFVWCRRFVSRWVAQPLPALA